MTAVSSFKFQVSRDGVIARSCKRRGNLAVVLALIILLPTLIFSSVGSAGTNSIFVAGTGSRALSMGSAFTALADDSSGVFFNPAGTVNMEKQQISLLHYPLYEGTLYNSITYSQPILEFGSLGAALYRVYTGDIITYSSSDVETGIISFEEYKATFSYATNINDVFSIGANVNFFNMSIDTISAFGIGADFGLLYMPFDFLSLGAMVHNLMKPTLAMQETREDLPSVYNAGICFKGDFKAVLANLTFDVSMGEEANISIRAGIETIVMSMVALRAGYDDGLISFGGGIEVFDASFDYAYINNEYLGGLSRFTLSYKFGMTLDEQKTAREKALKEQVKKIVEAEFRRKEIAQADKHYMKALAFYHDGKYESALDETGKAFEWHKESEKTKKLEKLVHKKILKKYFDSAMKQYKKKNYISALEGFKKVAKIDSKYNNTDVYLERIDKKLKMKGNSKKYFSEGVELYVNKQYDDAIVKWNKALKIAPRNTMIKSYISKARAKMKTTSGSSKVTEEQKQKAKKLYYSGLRVYTDGDLEGAVVAWKKALKINPEDIKSLKGVEKAQAELAELKKRGIK